MKAEYFRKAIPSILYYIVGFLITWLVSILERPHYAHGPNIFHLLGFLVFVGGVIWTLRILLQVLSGRNQYALAFAIHLVVIFTILFIFFYEPNKLPVVEVKSKPEDILTIQKDTINNLSSVINGAGDTLYFQRNDSILINKIPVDSNKNDYR